MKTLKRILLWTVVILAALCIAIALMWGGEIATLRTVSQVDDNQYLYQMEYKADYDLDEVIEKDIDSNAKLLGYVISRIGKGLKIKINSAQVADENGEMATFNCTSFQAAQADGEGFWYGRNYDYFKNPTMVTISHPKKGYASIAVSDMSHFGYSLEKLPAKFTSRVNCLAAVYAPVDGINEKGLWRCPSSRHSRMRVIIRLAPRLSCDFGWTVAQLWRRRWSCYLRWMFVTTQPWAAAITTWWQMRPATAR